MKFGLREIVFIVSLMAIPVGAWWFVFQPHNARDSQMRTEIAAKQEKLKALNYATGTIGNLRKQIASLSKAVEFFESKLPDEKEIDKVLQEVWHLAEKNNLITKSIRTLDRKQEGFTSTKSPHSEQPIEVQLEGDFMGFYAFLQSMENQPRIMRIRRMELTKPKKGCEATQGRICAEFIISVFFEKETS